MEVKNFYKPCIFLTHGVVFKISRERKVSKKDSIWWRDIMEICGEEVNNSLYDKNFDVKGW